MCALRLVTARERTQSELQLQREGKRRAGGRPESGEANSSKGFREAVANGHGGASAAINRGKQMVEAPHSHHFLAPSSLLVLFLFFFSFSGRRGGWDSVAWLVALGDGVHVCGGRVGTPGLRGRRWQYGLSK